MKIPNTVCSGCNHMLDMIYVMRGEFGAVNEAKCYHCTKEYPRRPCKLCKRDTIHVGFNFRACTECILDNNFNLETEFNKALVLLNSFMKWNNTEEHLGQYTLEVIKETAVYFEQLERRGYDKKHYTDDLNEHFQNSNKRVVVEQPENRPETD